MVIDFFLGSGTSVDVAQKLGRRWIGIEMAAYFDLFVLPNIKKVINNISGFFKYYELEQYEEALARCVYQDADLFNQAGEKDYQGYVFLKDEKMLKALEVDYTANKVKVDLEKLYPGIDIAETLSNLTGKWIKAIRKDEVEFADGTKINTKDLDYRMIKPLIWWE